MKKIALLTCTVSLFTASLAMGQAEVNQLNALGLGWTSCSMANPVGASDVSFMCQGETVWACPVYRLLPTFVSSITDNAFAGSTTSIDVLIGSTPIVGQWWSGLVPGGCRSTSAISTLGNITAASLPTMGACRNPYPAGVSTLPGQSSQPNFGRNAAPNRYRINSANSVFPLQTITIGERTYAMQLELKTEGTLADCDPTVDNTPVCIDGCSAGACFVLNDVDIYMEVGSNDPNPDIIHYDHDGGATRNWCTYQGGTGANCPGATPTRSSTWGAVKALYR